MLREESRVVRLTTTVPSTRSIVSDASRLWWSQTLGRYGLLLLFLAAFCASSLIFPATFPTPGNMSAMVSSQMVLLVLALAVSWPLRTGDFDLSIASVMIVSASIVAVLSTEHHVPVVVAAFISLLAGVAVGALNGFLVVILGLNAFISTLGTMTLVQGVADGVTNSQVVSPVSNSLIQFATHSVVGIPLGAIFGWVLAIALWYLYEFTPLGRYLLVIGWGREAAERSGLAVRRLRFSAFIMSALLSAFAGLLLAGSIGSVDPSTAPQYLLQPYAAVFLGTATIKLGQVNVAGTIIGLYTLVVISTVLGLAGVSAWVSELFSGVALVAGITFARFVGHAESSV